MIGWLADHPAMALGWRMAAVAVGATLVMHVVTMPPPDPLSLAELRRSTTAPTGAAPAPKPNSTPFDATYPAINAHPVFYPSRTPWKPPPPPRREPVVAPPPSLTSYSLVGVVISGDARRALIKPRNENKTVLLAEGQELKGWTLKEITADRARFVAGKAEYVMTFPRPSERR